MRARSSVTGGHLTSFFAAQHRAHNTDYLIDFINGAGRRILRGTNVLESCGTGCETSCRTACCKGKEVAEICKELIEELIDALGRGSCSKTTFSSSCSLFLVFFFLRCEKTLRILSLSSLE
jgi:hypothetical protein